MHIIHINFSISVGGIDTMLVDILNEQVKTIKTTLVIINNKIEECILTNLKSEVDVVRIGRKEGSKDLFKLIKLNFILFKLKPSIIHCHNSNVVNFLIFKKCPCVLTVHDVNYGVKSYHKYDEIYAISEAVKFDIQKKGKFPVSRIYNGVNDNLISKKNKIKESQIFKIVIISRLEYLKKGQDLVFRAIKNLNNNYDIDNVKLDLIGTGSSKDYLIALSNELEINGDVSFLGNKSRNYIYECLNNYDLLIQPSRYEGFGLTVVEAMLARVPVLTSNIDGPNEILNNGEYGYCFESDNIKDLTRKMKHIIQDYDNVYNSFTNKAYKHAKKNFSMEKTSLNYVSHYKKIIN